MLVGAYILYPDWAATQSGHLDRLGMNPSYLNREDYQWPTY